MQLNTNMKSIFPVVFAAVLGAAPAAHADVKLHRVFTDHIVLQRDINVNVWGGAAPGEKVAVQFGGQNLSALTDDKGKWLVALAPMKANPTPQNLTVAGKNKIELTDILVGDIWLCSGQSNMAFGVGGINTPEDVKSADYPLMRYRGGWGCWSGPLMEDLV